MKVLDAIEAVAVGKPVRPAAGGNRRRRRCQVRGVELALGDRGYIDDIRVPGMLHAALRLTDHVRADVAAIDTRRRSPPTASSPSSPRPTSPASCGSG